MLQCFLLLATCPVLQNLQKTFETRNTLGKAETIQVSQRVLVVIGVSVVVVVVVVVAVSPNIFMLDK